MNNEQRLLELIARWRERARDALLDAQLDEEFEQGNAVKAAWITTCADELEAEMGRMIRAEGQPAEAALSSAPSDKLYVGDELDRLAEDIERDGIAGQPAEATPAEPMCPHCKTPLSEHCPNCGLNWHKKDGYCATPGCGHYFGGRAAGPALEGQRERAFLEDVLGHLNGDCGTPFNEELWAAKELITQRLRALTREPRPLSNQQGGQHES